jgi:hypothetical protein
MKKDTPGKRHMATQEKGAARMRRQAGKDIPPDEET